MSRSRRGTPGDGNTPDDTIRLDVIDPLPIDAAPCVTPGPWTTPVEQTALSSTFDDWSPALTGDTLRMAFQSIRTGNAELYETTTAIARVHVSRGRVTSGSRPFSVVVS